MQKDKIIHFTFWLSLIAIVVSIITIILWGVSVHDMVVVNLDSFVGVCVTFLTMLVTIVLGWQIYNAIDIKEKIRTIKDLECSLKKQEHRMDQMYYNLCHTQSYTNATVAYKDKDYINAYRFLLNALANSVLMDNPINVEDILPEMKQCVELIPLRSTIEEGILEEMVFDHKTILQSPIFDCIRIQYTAIHGVLKSKTNFSQKAI